MIEGRREPVNSPWPQWSLVATIFVLSEGMAVAIGLTVSGPLMGAGFGVLTAFICLSGFALAYVTRSGGSSRHKSVLALRGERGTWALGIALVVGLLGIATLVVTGSAHAWVGIVLGICLLLGEAALVIASRYR